MKKYVKASVETPSETAKQVVFYALDTVRDSWQEYNDYNENDFTEIDKDVHSLVNQICSQFHLG